MIPISSAISGGLTWSKAPHSRGFVLNAGGEIVGSLQPTSCWSTEFKAECSDGSWRFRRTGFFRTATEILDAMSNTRVALLTPDWRGGGTVVFSDGQTFRLRSTGFWRQVWTVASQTGEPIMRVRSREKTVELATQFVLPEGRLALLVIFAWYCVQKAAQDAAAAASVVAATS